MIERHLVQSARLPITVLTPWFPDHPGSREGNFIYESARALCERGHRVSVLVARPRSVRGVPASTSGRPIAAHQFPELGAVHLVRYWSIPRNYFTAFSDRSLISNVLPELVRMVTASGSRVIHAHTEAMAPLAVSAASQTGARVAVTLHGVNVGPRFLNQRRRRVIGEALARADRVVLVGDSLRAPYHALAGRDDHFRVVPNGFGLNEVARRREALNQDGPVRFISVSNLHSGKGIDDNLRAFAELRRQGQVNWTYTIVGDGYQENELRKLVRESRLDALVTFAGELSSGDVAEQLADSDVFILPSSPEAFGIAYLEAMASGCLAVGALGQGPSAFIMHASTGLLVRARDIDGLAAQIRTIIDSPASFRDIARKGKELARTQFTWGNHAEKLIRVFREMVDLPH